MSFPTVALGEIFDIARGGSPRPIEDYITDDPDGLNWVLIGDATRSDKYIRFTEKRIRREGLKKSRAVKPGDFILSNSMSFGRPYIMATHGCIHDGWLVLKNGSKHADPDYLYHLLGSQPVYREFVKRAPGTTVKNLNTEIVSETRIPLPPLSEQRRVAAILDQADHLRSKRREWARIAERLRPAVFRDRLGEILRQSAPRKLGDLTSKIGSGATPRGGAESYQAAGIPLIRSMNVRDGAFSPDGLAFLSLEQARQLDIVRVCSNDVLVNITGASVARVCRAPSDLDGARVNQHVSIVRPTGDVLSEFLEAYLLLPEIKSKLLNIADSGATRQAITKAQLESLDIPLPPIELQKEFVSSLEEIARGAGQNAASATMLDSLFVSLQHRAFRGEL